MASRGNRRCMCHQLYRRTFDPCAAISYRPEVRSPCDSWERIASSKASRCAPERNRTQKNKTDRWWIGRSAASAHISASRTRVTPRNASRTGRPTPPRGRVGNRSLEYEYAELQYATVGRRRVCAAAAAELPSVTAARRLPSRPSRCAGGGLNPARTPIHHSLTRGRIYQGGYIFYAGASLAGAGYWRQCRRRPAILPLQLWQGCQGCVKISAQRLPRVAQFHAC